MEVDDIEATAKMNEICDQEGLDTISSGVTIAWAMEAFEKGLLPKDQLGGIELKFGNADAAIEVLKLMSRRSLSESPSSNASFGSRFSSKVLMLNGAEAA